MTKLVKIFLNMSGGLCYIEGGVMYANHHLFGLIILTLVGTAIQWSSTLKFKQPTQSAPDWFIEGIQWPDPTDPRWKLTEGRSKDSCECLRPVYEFNSLRIFLPYDCDRYNHGGFISISDKELFGNLDPKHKNLLKYAYLVKSNTISNHLLEASIND